jgi:hypothetical protein
MRLVTPLTSDREAVPGVLISHAGGGEIVSGVTNNG